MKLTSRFFGGIAVVALLFAVGCSSATTDSPKDSVTPETPTGVEENVDDTDVLDQVSLEVNGYMAANDALTSLTVVREDGSSLELAAAPDASYFLDGTSITPAEAVRVYQEKETRIFVALDTWVFDDPMDLSDGDVYTVANFTQVPY